MATAAGLAALLIAPRAWAASTSPPCDKGFETSEPKSVHVDIDMHRQSCDDPPYRAVVLEIDLTSKDIDFIVTPYNQRRLPTSEFAKRFDAIAATNGGFWCKNWGGFTVSSGQLWPEHGDNEKVAVIGFGGWSSKDKRHRVEIRPAEEVLEEVPGWVQHAMSGVPVVLQSGQVQKDDYKLFKTRHPRTGLGITKDGKTMFLVAVDGRQPGWSWGLRTWQLGELMKGLGAHTAINLDGGQSTTMVVPSLGGVVNKPCYKKGPERRVPNHLGIVERGKKGKAAALIRGLERLLAPVAWLASLTAGGSVFSS
jgi:hypothetical protein